MSVKFTNNAVAALAASVSTTSTTIAVTPSAGVLFPVLAAGDWFPVTVLDSTGAFEIMRCTARSGDTLTVTRAQEGTAAKAFNAGARVEHRVTSDALAAVKTEAIATAVATSAIGFTPVQQGGGAGQATNKIYIGWSGSGIKAQVDAVDYGTLWSTYNFNPGSYMPLTGANFTGNFGIYNTSPTVMFYDTDWGPRQLHCNSGLIGFLTSGGGWGVYSDDAGNLIASGNVAAYSDAKHKADIKPVAGALALVERLRGVRYTDKRTGQARVGVIAQEVQEVLPEVVGEGPDGLHVDYGNIVGPLIEAVKELAAEVRTMNRGL